MSAHDVKSPTYPRSIGDMVGATIALLNVQLKDLTNGNLPQMTDDFLNKLNALIDEADLCTGTLTGTMMGTMTGTDQKKKVSLALVQVALRAKKAACIYRSNREMKYVLGQELVVRRVLRILQGSPDVADLIKPKL